MGRRFMFRRKLKRRNVIINTSYNDSMVSIWDSGIEYGQYQYNTVYSNSTHVVNEERKLSNEFTKRLSVSVDNKVQKEKPELFRLSLPCSSSTRMPIEIPTWTDFTISTTIHGVRYVFDKTNVPMKTIRRMLWMSLVVCALALFLIQVYSRALTYFKYRTNTNIELLYPPFVTFPSVTICNQNSFRLTETVNRKLYSYIDMVYSNLSVDDLRNYDTEYIESVNLTDFILKLAHQKEDFFNTCTWKGEPCNISTDFQTIITDFGVCYTFNALENRTISQAGSGFALDLVLNIEQYQYMKGPREEAGIKVLLHDPSVIPLVKELGFAIAPGTHTLVAVKKNVIERLQQPWGVCVADSQSRSQCLSECRARHIIGLCGCHDPGMPSLNNSAVCGMQTSFGCVRRELDKFTRNGDGCNCTIPCYRITYQAELSYAHLSKLNVDRISLNADNNRKDVRISYRDARETSHRVNRVIAEADRSLMISVLESEANHQQYLNDTLSVLLPAQPNTTRHVLDVLHDVAPVFQRDFERLRAIYRAKSAIFSTRFPNLTFTGAIFRKMQTILYVDEVNQLQVELERCAALEQSGTPAEDEGFNACSDRGVPTTTWLSQRRDLIRELITMSRDAASRVQRFRGTYFNLTSYLFGGTLLNSTNQQHVDACLNELAVIEIRWAERLLNMSDVTTKYVNALRWIDKLSIAAEIHSYIIYFNVTSSFALTHFNFFNVCNWYVIEEAVLVTDQAFEQFEVHSASAIKSYYDSRGVLGTLTTLGIDLQGFIRSRRDFLFHPIDEFLDFNATKTELHGHLSNITFTEQTLQYGHMNTRYLTEYESFISKVNGIENNLRESFRLVFQFAVPVINASVVQYMQLIQYARLNGILSTEIENDLTEDYIDALGAIVSGIYGKYINYLQEGRTNMNQHYQNLQEYLNQLKMELDTFVKGNDIDQSFFRDNFIKIDIFYKEISHEQIKQQVSFELLSLISEIGGLLGLLLGASVLTVFELLDFLALAGIKKCRSRKFERYSN